MIFIIDADFREKSILIETDNWVIQPVFDDQSNVISYEVSINNGQIVRDISRDDYIKIQNSIRGNTPTKRIFISRNTRVSVENGH